MRLPEHDLAQSPSQPRRSILTGIKLSSLRSRVAGMVMGLGVLTAPLGCGDTASHAPPYPEYMDDRSKEVRASIDEDKIEVLLTKTEDEFIQIIKRNQACSSQNKQLISISSIQGDAKSYGEAAGVEVTLSYSCHNGQPKPWISYRASIKASYYRR